MANKDFLSQFSTNNKPDSFKEEERIPVANNKKPLNPKVLIIGIVSLIVIAALVVIIFFIPKIKVQNFVGLKKEDAVAWIRQQGIETSGIIFKEEYNFDNEEGTILSQDPESGKVSNKAKMTFVISNGPDPDERIVVPDFKTMDKESINAWIKENKLSSTRINSTYSDTVEENEFIEAKYSGCDEDSFTRGCTLKISVSKGAKPEDQILMQDFVKKTYAEFETWATAKKIKLEKTENYSDTVEAGIVISQSVKENEKVKAGDTVTVVVSKGKGVKVPDFSVMSNTEVDEWLKENAAYCKVTKKHYDSEDYIISQSAKTGAYIGTDNKLTIETNLGNHFYLDELGFTIVGNSYDKFKDYSYKWVDDLGVYIDTHKTWVSSSEPAGTILSIEKINNGTTTYSEVQRLPLEVEITCKVSNGEIKETFAFVPDTYINEDISLLDTFIDDNPKYLLDYNLTGAGTKIKTIKYNGTVITGTDALYLPYGTVLEIECATN